MKHGFWSLILALGVGVSLAAPAPASADTTTIVIRSTSEALAFEPDLFTVRAGTTVRIRYINQSVFSHHIVIVKKEADIDIIGPDSFHAEDTGFVPKQHRARMIAWSGVAAAGKTVEFTFTAPAPGVYPFVCFVDGHFNTMVGKMKSVASPEK